MLTGRVILGEQNIYEIKWIMMINGQKNNTHPSLRRERERGRKEFLLWAVEEEMILYNYTKNRLL